MTPAFWVLAATLFAALVLLGRPLGLYMAALADGRMPKRLLGAESRLLRLAGVQPDEEMGWGAYARALLLFNFLGVLAVYALQRLQGVLPLDPQHFGAVGRASSFNTAISFVTNTNWQGYSGESTMGNLVQMAGLAVQNFLSAATGIAVAFALIRGFARRSASTIGNFWVDLHRITSYVLLPIAFVGALVLVGQGVPQTLRADRAVDLIAPVSFQVAKTDAQGNPVKDAQGRPVTVASQAARQTLPMGPVASQEAIKELGTNGGGFFNANSAHPYENPNAFTNMLEVFLLLLISVALTFSFGRMVGDRRQGWALLAAMALMLGVGMGAEAHFERARSVRILPVPLALVHRVVGRRVKPIGIIAVGRIQREADAGTDHELAPSDHQTLSQCAAQLRGNPLGSVPATRFCEHDGELIATEPRQHVLRPEPRPKLSRRPLQHLIAHRVPERVVDLLEPIEIDDHQRQLAACGPRARHGLVQAAHQQAPVGQPGECIVQ
jgi:K+-transporting ATPase ATPase A chain